MFVSLFDGALYAGLGCFMNFVWRWIEKRKMEGNVVRFVGCWMV